MRASRLETLWVPQVRPGCHTWTPRTRSPTFIVRRSSCDSCHAIPELGPAHTFSSNFKGRLRFPEPITGGFFVSVYTDLCPRPVALGTSGHYPAGHNLNTYITAEVFVE